MRPRGHGRTRGFTLLETLIALAVALLLVGVVIAASGPILERARLDAAADTLEGAVVLARARAAESSSIVQVVVTTGKPAFVEIRPLAPADDEFADAPSVRDDGDAEVSSLDRLALPATIVVESPQADVSGFAEFSLADEQDPEEVVVAVVMVLPDGTVLPAATGGRGSITWRLGTSENAAGERLTFRPRSGRFLRIPLTPDEDDAALDEPEEEEADLGPSLEPTPAPEPSRRFPEPDGER